MPIAAEAVIAEESVVANHLCSTDTNEPINDAVGTDR